MTAPTKTQTSHKGFNLNPKFMTGTPEHVRQDYARLYNYINKVTEDPNYKLLEPNKQREAREKMYEEKILPYALSKRMVPIDKEKFVEGLDVSYLGKVTLGDKFNYAGDQELIAMGKMGRIGLKLDNLLTEGIWQALNMGTGLPHAITGKGNGPMFGPNPFRMEPDKLDKLINRWETRASDNYDHSWTEAILGQVGSNIPMLPLYMASSGLAGLATKSVTSTLGITNGVAKFATQRLIEASEGYLYDTIDKGKIDKPGQNTLTMPIMGTGFAGLKFLGRLVGLGGRPFAADVIKEAHSNYIDSLVPSKRRPIAGETEIGGSTISHEPVADAGPPKAKVATQVTGNTTGTRTLPEHNQPPRQPETSIRNNPNAPMSGLSGKWKITDQSVLTKLRTTTSKLISDLYKAHGYEYKIGTPPSAKITQAVQRDLGFLLGQSIKESALHNKDIVKAQVGAVLQHEAKTNPAAAKVTQTLEQASQIKATDAVASHMAEKAANANINGTAVIRGLSNESTVGAAKANSPEFLDGLLKYVDTTFKFENKSHKLLFLWGIKDQLPKEIVGRVKEELKLHPETAGHNSKDWTEAAKRLDEHLATLTRNANDPNIAQHGANKIFRSSSFLNDFSRFQNQLKAVDDLNRFMKKAPSQAKRAVKSIKAALDKMPKPKDIE